MCVNQTRIVAPRGRYDEIVEAFTEGYRALEIGDPMDPATDVGPLIHGQHRDRVEGYIKSGRDEGARVTIGGGRPEGLDRGFYVEPTIFADVDNGMTIAQEEIFGPVLSIIPYGDEDEAVRIANDSVYGLSGTVWGPDPEHAASIARRVRTGNIGVNLFMLDFAAPFGGMKESGIGREYGPEGIAAFTEIQSHPPGQAGRRALRAGAARAACASSRRASAPMSASACSHALYSRITPSGSPSSAAMCIIRRQAASR